MDGLSEIGNILYLSVSYMSKVWLENLKQKVRDIVNNLILEQSLQLRSIN